MTESTTPTPAAVARNDDDTPEPEYIIADACEEWVRTEQTGKDLLLLQSESYELGLTVRRALSADGYAIAGPGQVAVSLADLTRLHECFKSPGIGNRADAALWYRVRDLINTALGASQDAKGAS